MDALWERTQRPELHKRWDLRFTEIDYLPRADDGPQRFLYTFKLLPGLVIKGTGITTGDRHDTDGRTSALRFSSGHPLSLMRSGSGYWRYVPTSDGVRFITRYGYRPGWGRAVDLVFRPLIGWATAWSFDRLRLWLETGQTPERSLWQAVAELCVRVLAVGIAIQATPAVIACLIGAAAILLPPLPSTPAARRCLRRPPDRLALKAPLTHLEMP